MTLSTAKRVTSEQFTFGNARSSEQRETELWVVMWGRGMELKPVNLLLGHSHFASISKVCSLRTVKECSRTLFDDSGCLSLADLDLRETLTSRCCASEPTDHGPLEHVIFYFFLISPFHFDHSMSSVNVKLIDQRVGD